MKHLIWLEMNHAIRTPLRIIDYIVAYELVHFVHKDHSKAFWNERVKVMKDYLGRKICLKYSVGVDLRLVSITSMCFKNNQR